ncbi:MAG: hypothetical protein HOV81_34850 [Kofleriaceae bacterium]|nr:hypothetical protein [Kofleriaceae bacterium]
MRAVVVLLVAAGCGRLGFGSTDARDDAVASDGASSDATRDGASVGCSPAFDLCDDFEGPTLDGAIWTADSMVTLDTTRAHRGAKSVHVHMPSLAAGSGDYQTLRETTTITSGATTFWVRAWFWLSALPAGGNGLELVTAERPGSAGDYLFVFSDRTALYTQFVAASQTAMATVPTGTWFCAVWKVVRATNATGSIALSGDAPAITLANTTTDSATLPMTVVNLGIGFSGTNLPVAQPALDLWIDDVIAHSSPVGCTD